jgi:PII-like signaling protein
MPEFAKRLGASKGAATLLVLFIPSRDRWDEAIDQSHWVDESLEALAKLFGGATAYPQGKGVWRDDAQGGKLLFDEPVVIQCYTSEEAIERRVDELKEFLHRMGREAKQGAIGLVIDREYLEIGFPREATKPPRQPKGKKRR